MIGFDCNVLSFPLGIITVFSNRVVLSQLNSQRLLYLWKYFFHTKPLTFQCLLSLVQTGVPLASNKMRASHFLMGTAPILLHESQVKIKKLTPNARQSERSFILLADFLSHSHGSIKKEILDSALCKARSDISKPLSEEWKDCIRAVDIFLYTLYLELVFRKATCAIRSISRALRQNVRKV